MKQKADNIFNLHSVIIFSLILDDARPFSD